MKKDYKSGDKVRIIKYCPDNKLDIGREFEVNKVNAYGVFLGINNEFYYVFHEIELLEESFKSDYDNINPSHYKNMSVEVFDMMVLIYGKEKVKTFCELNAFKYRMRLGNKPDNSIEQEMKKVKWYESKMKELC